MPKWHFKDPPSCIHVMSAKKLPNLGLQGSKDHARGRSYLRWTCTTGLGAFLPKGASRLPSWHSCATGPHGKIRKRSIKWVRVIYTWKYSLQSIPKALNGEDHFKGFPIEHPDGLDSCCCCRLLQARIAKWSEALVEHVPNIKTWKRKPLLWMGVNFSLNRQWKRRFESCTNASILQLVQFVDSWGLISR